MTESVVLVDRRGAVGLLTLNRPDRANAINARMRRELHEATSAIAADDTVQVVVVTGAGSTFSGGADLSERRAVREEARNRYAHTTDLSVLPQPVIAAINGPALGGGCEMALTCDFRIMADGARIGLPEIRFGALPRGGGTVRLPKLVGLSAAKRMIMTGAVLDAAEAARIGLVDQVVPAEELADAAAELAARMAEHAGYALRTAKALLNATVDLDVASGRALESRMVRGMASPEERRAAAAAAAKRSPTYAKIFGRRTGDSADNPDNPAHNRVGDLAENPTGTAAKQAADPAAGGD